MNILSRKKTSKGLIQKDDSEILKILNQRRQVYEDHAKNYHPIWYLCFLRACGQHYAEFNHGSWSYVKSKPYIKEIERYAPRPKIDKVAKSIDHLIGLLTDGFPICRAKAASDDPTEEDRMIAKLVDEWIRYKQERVLYEDEANEETFLWILSTGNFFRQGYLKDTQEEIPFIEMADISTPTMIPAKKCTACGELSDNESERCLSCGAGADSLVQSARMIDVPSRDVKKDEHGNPVMNNRPGKDIGQRGISPFQFFPNHRGKNFRNLSDWYIVNVVSNEWIESNYDVKPRSLSDGDRMYDAQKLINDMVPDVYGESLYYEMKEDDHTCENGIVYEYYQRPIPGYDNDGAFIIHTDKDIIKKSPYPYRGGVDGIVHYGWRPTGRFWYAGYAESLFPVNDHINSVLTQAAHARKMHANQRLWLPSEAGVNRNDVMAGKSVIEFDGEVKPFLDNPADVSGLIKFSLEVLYSDYREMDGLQDILRGVPPKNARTASGYQMLLESASNPFKRKISRVQRLNRELWEFQVWQAQNLFDENQVLKIAQGKFAGKLFTARDIRGYLTIDIDQSAPFPRSRAAQQQRAVEMMQYVGNAIFMRDPHAMHEFMAMMDIQTAKFDPMFERHQEQAQKESIAMKAGQKVPINQFDNHNIHLYEHQLCYFSDDVQGNPQAAQIIAEHMKLHQIEYTKKQAQNFKAGQFPTPGQKQEESQQQQPVQR